MSDTMIDCPICERRVFATNNICPGCNTDLSNESGVQRDVLKRKTTANAIAARAKGASFGEIESQLAKEGLDGDQIEEIMVNVKGATPEAMAAKSGLDMRHGFYWLLGGILVSVVTYLIASNSKNGGVYFIAYGAVLAGGIQFMRGLLNSAGKK